MLTHDRDKAPGGVRTLFVPSRSLPWFSLKHHLSQEKEPSAQMKGLGPEGHIFTEGLWAEKRSAGQTPGPLGSRHHPRAPPRSSFQPGPGPPRIQAAMVVGGAGLQGASRGSSQRQVRKLMGGWEAELPGRPQQSLASKPLRSSPYPSNPTCCPGSIPASRPNTPQSRYCPSSEPLRAGPACRTGVSKELLRPPAGTHSADSP